MACSKNEGIKLLIDKSPLNQSIYQKIDVESYITKNTFFLLYTGNKRRKKVNFKGITEKIRIKSTIFKRQGMKNSI